MNDINLLDSVFKPKKYEYEMSELLFLDIWEEWQKPSEISDGEKIRDFLNQIIDKSRGLFILDHFSNINYDHVTSVKYKKPFLEIYWKDLNEYREKYLRKELTDDDQMIWCVHGYSTYMYMLLNINKIKFVKKGVHLYILFLTNLIPEKLSKKHLLDKNNELIDKENYKNLLYNKFTFFEGDKNLLIKHDCIVNNLPYFSCLIQPKENNKSTGYSRNLLLIETLKEISNRMERVLNSLSLIDEFDYDELFSSGNKIRRILEYCLKFLCIYKNLNLDIEKKYGFIKLGDLKKEIKANYNNLRFDQSLINTANELSHDSGKIFEKEEVIKFWNEVNDLIEEVYDIILNDK